MYSMSMESVSQFFTMRRERQTSQTVLKATTVPIMSKQKGDVKMENERVNVIILDRTNDGEPKYLRLTPDQLNFLKWLDEEGMLWDYIIKTDFEFESI